jgi:hypothetical protein
VIAFTRVIARFSIWHANTVSAQIFMARIFRLLITISSNNSIFTNKRLQYLFKFNLMGLVPFADNCPPKSKVVRQISKLSGKILEKYSILKIARQISKLSAKYRNRPSIIKIVRQKLVKFRNENK